MCTHDSAPAHYFLNRVGSILHVMIQAWQRTASFVLCAYQLLKSYHSRVIKISCKVWARWSQRWFRPKLGIATEVCRQKQVQWPFSFVLFLSGYSVFPWLPDGFSPLHCLLLLGSPCLVPIFDTSQMTEMSCIPRGQLQSQGRLVAHRGVSGPHRPARCLWPWTLVYCHHK